MGSKYRTKAISHINIFICKHSNNSSVSFLDVATQFVGTAAKGLKSISRLEFVTEIEKHL